MPRRESRLGARPDDTDERSEIGYVANTTFVDTVLASKEHQHIAIDHHATDGAPLELGLECRLKRRHVDDLLRKTKPPSGVYSPDGFAMLGPDGGQ
jgi:hypothetical protein